MISGFEALRQSRAQVAGLEPATARCLFQALWHWSSQTCRGLERITEISLEISIAARRRPNTLVKTSGSGARTQQVTPLARDVMTSYPGRAIVVPGGFIDTRGRAGCGNIAKRMIIKPPGSPSCSGFNSPF
ncbi:hypothetical protein PoB_000044500 [Plakobranchus ocellatus]|uniref:Uncharacterized protein n=1 Tax=Plakobranchus ocellatus TaxID=259542 RepID=A0AAV3XS94_9GAST|nr:hypothetical protein PoB_000044500 [Plakobranchus ocellatus]